MKYTVNQVEEDCLNYFAGGKLGREYSDEQREIMAYYNKLWDAVETDGEGPTKDQEKELDEILDSCINEVMAK